MATSFGDAAQVREGFICFVIFYEVMELILFCRAITAMTMLMLDSASICWIRRKSRSSSLLKTAA